MNGRLAADGKSLLSSMLHYIADLSLCSGPVVATVWEGKGVVVTGRKLVGATNPLASGEDDLDICASPCLLGKPKVVRAFRALETCRLFPQQKPVFVYQLF